MSSKVIIISTGMSVLAAGVAIVAVLYVLFSPVNQAPTRYIHSIGISEGETRYLKVKGYKVEGVTVDYTLTTR